MGGMTIMCLAAARPELFGDRVRGVALVSTSAGDLTADPRSAAGRMQPSSSPGMLNAALGGAGVLERLRAAPAAGPPAAPEDGPRACSTAPTPPTRWCSPGPRSCTPRPSGPSSPSCPPSTTTTSARSSPRSPRVPVEILVGDSDQLTPKRHSRQLADALPDADLHVVERTGHMLPQERPQLVADAIERLLAAATADRTAA